MLHKSYVANYRGRLRYCRETSGTGSRVAFARYNPCRNGRPTERQTIARCRLTSVRGSHLVDLRAVAYPSSINGREWCLEGGGAPRAISISYAVGILASPNPRTSAVPHHCSGTRKVPIKTVVIKLSGSGRQFGMPTGMPVYDSIRVRVVGLHTSYSIMGVMIIKLLRAALRCLGE